jgi:hypothetical protein
VRAGAAGQCHSPLSVITRTPRRGTP